MRKRYDNKDWAEEHHTSSTYTPRNLRPPSPFENSRQSNTPSRIQERLTTSPLKGPLEKAISRAVRRDSSMERTSQSRYLGRSSRREESSIISLAKKIYYDEDS